MTIENTTDVEETAVGEESVEQDEQVTNENEDQDVGSTNNDNELDNPETDDSEDEDDNEVTISFGDDPEDEEDSPEESEQSLPKHLRKVIREKDKEVRKLKREKDEEIESLRKQLELKNGMGESQVKSLGPKPKIEDFDYDEDKYDEAIEGWMRTRDKIKDKEKEKQAEQERHQQEWQSRLDNHEESKSKLKVTDFDEAEFSIQESLSPTQQGIIISGSENSAAIMYALGKNPKKLKEVSEISDPIKFAMTIAKMETTLKVKPKRKPQTTPEPKVKGGTSGVSSLERQLEQLREKAVKTGDFSQVLKFRREHKLR